MNSPSESPSSLRRKRPYLILIVAILWMIFFPLWRDWVTATPLNVPISFAKKIEIRKEVIIRAEENYDLNLVFDRRGVSFEEIKRLVGNSSFCIPNELPCSKGVPVVIRWNFVDQNTSAVIASGDRETHDSNGWSAEDVDRIIAQVNLPRGKYLFSAETFAPVPDLAALHTSLTLGVRLKDITSSTFTFALVWGQIIWYLLAPLVICFSIGALIRREYLKRLAIEKSQH